MYKTIFFDLDHTLWDFKTNSRETIADLHAYFDLYELGASAAEFIEAYEEVNETLWKQYARGKIDRSVLRVLRWRRTFLQFGIRDAKLHKAFGDAYIDQCPQRTTLMPGAKELVTSLYGQVPMCIITNGFSEVQKIKLEKSGLVDYFDAVITSEMASAKKPSLQIFELALKKMKATAKESLMVGDSQLADIIGSLNAGMHAAHLDVDDAHLGEPANVRIKELGDLQNWLG